MTGSSGFIAGYLLQELLDHGHTIIGIDNLSKYGESSKSYDDHPNYKFIKGDVKDFANELHESWLTKKKISDIISTKKNLNTSTEKKEVVCFFVRRFLTKFDSLKKNGHLIFHLDKTIKLYP